MPPTPQEITPVIMNPIDDQARWDHMLSRKIDIAEDSKARLIGDKGDDARETLETPYQEAVSETASRSASGDYKTVDTSKDASGSTAIDHCKQTESCAAKTNETDFEASQTLESSKETQSKAQSKANEVKQDEAQAPEKVPSLLSLKIEKPGGLADVELVGSPGKNRLQHKKLRVEKTIETSELGGKAQERGGEKANTSKRPEKDNHSRVRNASISSQEGASTEKGRRRRKKSNSVECDDGEVATPASSEAKKKGGRRKEVVQGECNIMVLQEYL